FWRTLSGIGDAGSLVIGDQDTSYVRGPDGRFQLIGLGSLTDDPYATGRLITSGGTHIVFTSDLRLEPDAAASVGPGSAPHYTAAVGAVYDRTPVGPTHVVSLLPGDQTPAPGATTYYRGISADGSAVVFSVDNTTYVRRDNSSTVQVATTGSPSGLT